MHGNRYTDLSFVNFLSPASHCGWPWRLENTYGSCIWKQIYRFKLCQLFWAMFSLTLAKGITSVLLTVSGNWEVNIWKALTRPVSVQCKEIVSGLLRTKKYNKPKHLLMRKNCGGEHSKNVLNISHFKTKWLLKLPLAVHY